MLSVVVTVEGLGTEFHVLLFEEQYRVKSGIIVQPAKFGQPLFANVCPNLPGVRVYPTLPFCLGGSHRPQAVKEIELGEPQKKIQVITNVYEGLLKDECWRVVNLYNVDEKASKAMLTFQDQ